MYNIRFIALNDHVDTADKDSSALDMMPIVNLFNEWHAASTSKKIKSVIEVNAKSGKYRCTYAPYGYDKGTDENRLPVVDPVTAPIVKRIFEMRASGISPRHVADKLNEEHILIPSDYRYQKIGKVNPRLTNHLWSKSQVRDILNNPIYLGQLAQLRTTTVSHKNHKTIKKDPSEWVVIENTHEPIITQELWDKVREVEQSVSVGKRTKKGETLPLSGLMYCADCGNKMRLNCNNTTTGSKKKPRKYYRQNYTCGNYSRSGKIACSSHYIKLKEIEGIVLADIRSMVQLTVDEKNARQVFLAKKQSISNAQNASDMKRFNEVSHRLTELEKVMQTLYEDRVLGKISEDVCMEFLAKYGDEKKQLAEEKASLSKKISSVKKDEQDVEEFICRLKKYTNVEELTREMCLELIEYIMIGDRTENDEPREIQIYYKLLDNSLPNKRNALL